MKQTKVTDRWSPENYDKHSAFQYESAVKLLDKINFTEGWMRVLDIGCGTGKITKRIAEKIHAGFVVGIDLSAEMINFANKKYGYEKKLRFTVMDAQSLSFDRESFDLILSFWTLSWIKDHERTIEGIFQALDKGGQIFLLVPLNNQDIESAYLEIKNFPKWKDYFIEYDAPRNAISLELYEGLLKKHEFHELTLQSSRIDRTFGDKKELNDFIESWLPYKERIPKDFQSDFIDEFVNVYLKLTGQELKADSYPLFFDIFIVRGKKPGIRFDKSATNTNPAPASENNYTDSNVTSQSNVLPSYTDIYSLNTVNQHRHHHVPVTYLQASKRIIKVSLPIAVTLVGSLNVVACGLLTAQLGKDSTDHEKYLAASALITAEQSILMILSTSLLYSVSVPSGFVYGELKRDEYENETALEKRKISKEKITKILKNGLYMSGLCCIPPMVFMWFTESILIQSFRQDPEVVYLVEEYFKSYLGGVPGILGAMCFEQLLFGLDKQNFAAALSVVNFFLGVAIAYVLAFGRFTLPRLGLSGIGYGFLVQAYLNFFAYGLYLLFGKDLRDYRFFSRPWSIDTKTLRSLIRTGWPITLSVSTELTAVFLVNIFAGMLGKTQLAAQDISSQLAFFLIIPILAISQACSNEVSRAMGKHHFIDVKRYGFSGIFLGSALLSMVAIAVSLYPKMITVLFSVDNDSQVLTMTKTLLPITAGGMVFDSIRNVLTGALRGTGDAVSPSIITSLLVLAGILSAYGLGFECGLGIYGIAAGYTFGLVSGAFSLLARWGVKAQEVSLTKTRYKPQYTEQNKSSYWRSCFPFFRVKQDGERQPLLSGSSTNVTTKNSVIVPTHVNSLYYNTL